MPFQSKAQSRYMSAVHPKLAKEFAAKTKDLASLPEKAGDKKMGKRPIKPKY